MKRNRTHQLFGAVFVAVLLGLSLFVQEGKPALRLLEGAVAPAWASGSAALPTVSIAASHPTPDPGREFLLLLEIGVDRVGIEGTTATLDLPTGLELAGEPSLQTVCQASGTCTGTLAGGYAGSGTLVESLTLPDDSFAAIAVPVKVAGATATGTDFSVHFTATDANDEWTVTSDPAPITVAEDCNPELDTVVTHHGDSGPGSLRCLLETLPAGATITFADDFTGDNAIALDATLYVTRSLTIDGGSHSVEVDGGWDGADTTTGVRVMTLLPGADEVTLRGVTLRRGNGGVGASHTLNPSMGGGGLRHLAGNGVLQLEAVTLQENLAQYGGGLFNANGHVVMHNVMITANRLITEVGRGGGVYNYAGTLSMNRSNLVGNGGFRQYQGGGLYNYGDAVLTDVLFRGNQSRDGGGLLNTGQATLTNVLFDSNTGIANNTGEALRNHSLATLRHVTITGSSSNSRGLSNIGSLALYNSVIADNDGDDCANIGTLTANVGNWIADGTCAPAYTGDPKLDAAGTPLADSGLIDAADSGECPAADLNGLARPQGAGCDIGAVEFTDGATHTLTLAREGSGSVVADTGAIDCGQTCSGSYAENAYITLTATPGSEGHTVTWNGCDSSDATRCEVTLTGDRTVTVTFAPPSYSLTLDAGTGGTITADPNQAEYLDGTAVTLTASPDSGHSFGGWVGACSGSDTTCELVMGGDMSVGARFFTGGDGSQDAPWGIGTADQLDALRHDRGKHYRLTADIDLTDWLAEEGPGHNEGAGWEPISFFWGAFDGNGHRIRGLTIQRPDQDRVGLFGAVESGGVVKNLELAYGTIEGRQYVGAIAGSLSGEVTGSRTIGNIVKGDSDVGGLVGRIYSGAVSRSYANDSVSGNQRIGGLAGSADRGWEGHAELLVSNAFADSNVNGGQQIGGLLGELVAGGIATSHSLGYVHGSSGVDVGGLVGLSGGSIDSSYWDIEGTTQATSAGGTGLTRAEMLHSANLEGFDFSEVWRQYDGDTPPLLRHFLSPLTVTALDASGEVGAPLPDFAVTYDLPEQEVIANIWGTPHFVHDANDPPESAGSYPLTPAGLASRVYDITFAPGTLTVLDGSGGSGGSGGGSLSLGWLFALLLLCLWQAPCRAGALWRKQNE